MSKGIEIIRSTIVSLPSLPHTPPPIKLSFFDCLWVVLPPVQKLLVFSNPSTNISFPSLLQIIKSSLSSALIDFLPLVGKLTYIPSAGDVEIDLSDPSYIFVEAESDLELHQLATNKIHDVESLSKLVPVIDASMLPFPALAVQVTRFNCGGMAIGYSIHHAVADGKASNQFIERWSSVCRARIMDNADLPIERRHLPLYDRAVIKNPKGEELAREFLRTLTPTLPNTNSNVLASVVRERHHLDRRTFLLNAPSIRLLKQLCTGHETNNSMSRQASTFTAISAYAWSCVARSKSFDPDDQTFFSFLMDCRSRLSPPIHEAFLGNCVRPIIAKLLVRELIEEAGLVRACTTIQKLIDAATKDPLGDGKSWAANIKALPFQRTVNVAGSPKFRVYENDFGWGKPERVELVSMNNDGEFVLVGGKDAGSVQVTVALNPTQMETFSELFLGGLSG